MARSLATFRYPLKSFKSISRKMVSGTSHWTRTFRVRGDRSDRSDPKEAFELEAVLPVSSSLHLKESVIRPLLDTSVALAPHPKDPATLNACCLHPTKGAFACRRYGSDMGPYHVTSIYGGRLCRDLCPFMRLPVEGGRIRRRTRKQTRAMAQHLGPICCSGFFVFEISDS